MELINQSAEIWQQGNTLEDMWKHIARCTRVCYQTEKKNNGESDEEFCKRTILKNEPLNSSKNHLAMLEHGTIYLTVPRDSYNEFEIINVYKHNPYSDAMQDDDNTYITTNYRVIVEYDRLKDLEYLSAPTEHHVKRVTISCITNIGVSREFNRHRVHSIAEESTRYCNYNLDKFNKSITFCLPKWTAEDEIEIQACRPAEVESDMYADMRVNMELSDNWNTIDWYLYALSTCALAYEKLISLGWKPQQAREVLPLATKTQLIHTAFVDDWKHFLTLRLYGISGAPHPNMKELAKLIKEELVKYEYL